jgi:UDP-N-acetylglucosamine 4-epimerase
MASVRDLPVKAMLAGRKRTWLVTGSAGFIGSQLLEHLLRYGQQVVSLDSFATGHRANLEEVERAVGPQAWRQHRFIEASIVDPAACREACRGVDIVLHQAALGSVPRSIADPVPTHQTNVTGFVNMLVAARDAKVRRFVYASSSSIYGDDATLPKVEGKTGEPLSPYAASKQANEMYADVFARCYGIQTVGLRYFNVFGARQDPEGAYAAVIPRWIRAIMTGEPLEVNGDGENTSLNRLLEILRTLLAAEFEPVYRPFRAGDVRHSLADISLARERLGYAPTHTLASGLKEALPWYVKRFESAPALQR